MTRRNDGAVYTASSGATVPSAGEVVVTERGEGSIGAAPSGTTEPSAGEVES